MRMNYLSGEENLLESPNNGIVVYRSVDLRAESSSFAQVIRCSLQRGNHQLVLDVRVLTVG